MRTASIAASKQCDGVLGRDDRHRRLAVPAEHRVEQVRLLGLRRQSRRGAAALDVDDEQRQLEGDREPDRLGLEIEPGSTRGRDAERAAEGRAEGRAHAGDLVLCLEGAHAEVLLLRQLVEQSDAGVIGYDPRKSGRPERCEAATSPQARAVLPVTLVYVPGSRCDAGIS